MLFFLLLTSVLTLYGVSTTSASSHSNIEITTDTTLNSPQSYTNQSVIVNNTAILTISNTIIDFQNYTNTGFIVDNGSLVITNSVIKGGDKCITGYNTGNITIVDSTIQGCLNDAIELGGNYNLTVTGTTFVDIGNRGLDMTGLLPNVVKIFDTTFDNTTGDAIKSGDTDLWINNTIFTSITGNAIDTVGTGVLTAENIVMNNILDHAFNLDDPNYAYITNVTMTQVQGDGIKADNLLVLNVNEVTMNTILGDGFDVRGYTDIDISNVILNSLTNEGIKLAGSKSIDITDSNIQNPLEDGIDISLTNATINVKDTIIDGSSSQDGFQVHDSTGFVNINGLSLLNNEQNGIELTNVTNEVTILNSVASTNILAGIEIIDSPSVSIQNTQFNQNSIGVFFNNSGNLEIEESEINNNDLGFYLAYSDIVRVHNSEIVGNTFDVNATLMQTGSEVSMERNYWGTTNYDEINIIGDVSIEPILDTDGMEISSPLPMDSTTTPVATPSESGGLSSFYALMVIVNLGIYSILRRKRNL